MTQLTPRQQVEAELGKREAYLDHLDNHPEELTLNFLAEHDLPIFVRNIMRIPAVNILEVKTPDGRKITLQIADTSIPQELTNRVNGAILANAYHLIKALNDETIELVNPRRAIEELKSPSAQRKLARINVSRMSKNSEAPLPKNFAPKTSQLERDRNIAESAQNELAIENKQAQAPISARLTAIITEYQDNKIDQDNAIDRISDAARSFSTQDWLHLKRELPDAEIQAMCDQMLNIQDPI